ncbi:MAG: PAS domain S-box protein [Pseudomonadota bacterium]
MSAAPPTSTAPAPWHASVFSTSAIGCAILALDGRCLDANAALCDMLGYTREDVIGQSILTLTHEDDQRPSQALMVGLRSGNGDPVVLEKRYLHRDGRAILARLTAHAVFAPDGSASHFVSVMEDQSALHHARARAISVERHFKETLNRAAVGVLLTSEDGRFLSVNTTFAKTLGYEPDELEGLNFRAFSAPEDLPVNAHRRSALWAGDVDRVVAEKRWVHKNGQRIWTRMTISIARELDLTEPYSIAIVEDITAAKEMEEAQRLLVGELNHRVKNTLAVVQGMIKRTLANTPDPGQFASVIEGRLQSISSAHDLLSQSDWRDLDLRRLFERAVTDVFPAHAAQFDCDLDSISLSPNQATTLALVFHELTTNAIKHGALSVSTGRVVLIAKRKRDAAATTAIDTLDLTWREVGGPPIHVPPSRSGFGSFLLKRGIAHSLSGTASYTFEPDGLVVHATLPVPRAVASPEAQASANTATANTSAEAAGARITGTDFSSG